MRNNESDHREQLEKNVKHYIQSAMIPGKHHVGKAVVLKDSGAFSD